MIASRTIAPRRCIVIADRAARPRPERAPARRAGAPSPPGGPHRGSARIGRYRIGRRLGAGGSAEVFAAEFSGEGGFAKRVAVKRLLPGIAETERSAARFLREARLLSRLSHPNVLQVLDLGRDEDARPFIVMERVDGLDLAELIRSGPVPPEVAIFVAGEVLSGLGYLHGRPGDGMPGVVHRDLSPHNVLLSWRGEVKIADFGLAKATIEGLVPTSRPVRGTAGYMSPEQIDGGDLDGRADLFAAGVLLWELLVGDRLFAGPPREAMARALFRAAEPPGARREGVPEDLARIAMRLLARDRDERYATAELALAELERCRDAPRACRSELERLLDERFPGMRAAPPAGRPSCSGSAASGGTRTESEEPEPESGPFRQPLFGASSSSTSFAEGPRRRWRIAAYGAFAIAVALLALVFGR